MTWTNIPNANLAAGAPIRSVDLIALRDNITAQANGDAGAPKTQNAAIASGIVNSLNGQQGNIVNTDLNSIGSVVRAAYYSSSGVYAGQTVSGSVLYVPNAYVAAQSGPGGFTSQYTSDQNYTMYQMSAVTRRNAGPTGANPPQGSATLSGTWRCMSYGGPLSVSYDADNNITFTQMTYNLFVRVS
jgi:hypothetical protein